MLMWDEKEMYDLFKELGYCVLLAIAGWGLVLLAWAVFGGAR
jgi:hypothetical protein